MPIKTSVIIQEISTSEGKQDFNRQIHKFKAAGAEEVIFEYEHGDAKLKPSP